MARRKTKYKITLLEAQRRRLEALERWIKFIKGDLPVIPEQFDGALLFPTFWSLGGSGSGYSPRGSTIRERADGTWEALPSAEEVEEIRKLIMNGLEKLVDEGVWILSLDNLEISVTQHGPSYAGTRPILSQLGVAQLLRTEEWRTARCAWCGDLFLKKKRGEYCNVNHSQRMRTFRARNPRAKTLLKEAAKAKIPIAVWLSEERLALACPGCHHAFRVPAPLLPAWTICTECKMGIRIDPLNMKSFEEKK